MAYYRIFRDFNREFQVEETLNPLPELATLKVDVKGMKDLLAAIQAELTSLEADDERSKW